ncbi:MAG: aminoacyltransferase [Oscillospiraceae bacterium]|jgi:lipid II:glycine glycyltransferase (peptidoglycan interpeptide bridge formation enzyme)|nr:aminoacyltransferase [Oscillospiraceae bacterium]
MEILSEKQYDEYERFAAAHERGGITQSVRWHGVKSNWGHEVVVSRDSEGNIAGGVSILVQKTPVIGTSLLYSPRGPVCDLYDRTVMADLKEGIDTLAKKYKAHVYKMDPDVLADDTAFIGLARAMGFTQIKGGTGFETIQARFNYRLYLDGRGEEAVFKNLTQKTRYNVRVAQKHGVEIRVAGSDGLDEFMRLMHLTGDRDGFNIRPKAYFARMLESLGEHARLYMAFFEGEAVSGALTTNYAGKTCYIYGASDNAHRNVMPNYLIQWEMIKWAIETGCTVYDFQGVSGNLDESDPLYGLYRFKKGFNGTLDELAGEFDYIYRPIRAKMVDLSIDLSEKLRAHRRSGGQ